MKGNLTSLSLILGVSAILTACNTVQGTMHGASRDIHAVTSAGQSAVNAQNRHGRSTTTSSNNPEMTGMDNGNNSRTTATTRTHSNTAKSNPNDPGNPFTNSASQN
jgi:predicted small secreted protein